MNPIDFTAGRDYNKAAKPKQKIGYSGFAPFLRGPYTGMYTIRPWTIRQYSGFSTAEESNAFYRRNLEAGQKGLSVAFDLPTHRGYDSDNPRVSGDVGQAGVAIDSIEDMKILFRDIPLDQISVSMTMNGAVIPIMAFFIATAVEQGVTPGQLKGTIQNDILKEFMVRNTYIYPPAPSMKIIGDIMAYTSAYMPRFNSISVSGYHMHEAGATAAVELGYTLADGVEYIRTALKAGLNIDEVAPRISFFWGIGMNHLTEIAKLRAARVIWADLVSQFKPKNPKSLTLRTHCQTSGWSLTAQEPYNNLMRTSIEAFSAILGGTQSLHTNSFDEALALPTDYSARLARNTQLIMANDTDITRAIDPLGGSCVIEEMTESLISEASAIISDVETKGGMSKIIEAGLPKMRIEKDAAEKQAKIDNGQNKIVGVNTLVSGLDEEVNLLDIDNREVLRKQLQKLDTLKRNRDKKRVEESLQKLKKAASAGDSIMPKAIEAAKNRATLGEISLILEEVYSRYSAKPRLIQGVYKSQMDKDEYFLEAQKMVKDFAKEQGRQPRILVTKMGQDGHDRGAKIIATAFADLGFDVDVGPLFQTPQEVLNSAFDSDVHFIGISSLAGAHTVLIPELLELLVSSGNDDIKVIVGGIIPESDHEELYSQGVLNIFGPGTNIAQAAISILKNYSSSKNS